MQTVNIETYQYRFIWELPQGDKLPAGTTVICGTDDGLLVETPFLVIREPNRIRKGIIRTSKQQIIMSKKEYLELMNYSEPINESA